MAPGGTRVVAPEDGYVYRLSGGPTLRGSVFGYSLYLKGKSGADYFLTHLGGYAADVGSVTSTNPRRVTQGQILGYIGNWPGDPKRSHLHMGVSGANAGAIAHTPQGSAGGVGGGLTAQEQFRRALGSGSRQAGGIAGLDSGLSGIDIIEGITGKNLPDVDANPIDVLTAPVDAIRWVGGNWDRVLEVVGGFILLLVGLVLLGRSMGIGGARRVGGDLMNRLEYGPTVVQATRQPRQRIVYSEETAPRSRASSGAVGGEGEIPF